MKPTIFSTAPQTAEDTDMLPPGMLAHFGGPSAPSGWLVCDGSDYLSADYPALSAYLAGTWDTFRAASPGAGRFRVPKANGLALIAVGGADSVTVNTSARALADLLGEETHALSASEHAAHSHILGTDGGYLAQSPDAMTVGGAAGADIILQSLPNGVQSTAPQGDGTAHNNMQPSVAALLCIKT